MKSIGESIRLLNDVFNVDLVGVNMYNDEVSEHAVKHNYRETIIVPVIALTNNLTFIMSKGDKYITFMDGTRSKVVDWKEEHICELEDKIKELYNIDCWTFIKRWYNSSLKEMDNMHFLVIKVEKKGE